jgi:hypothetical protein
VSIVRRKERAPAWGVELDYGGISKDEEEGQEGRKREEERRRYERKRGREHKGAGDVATGEIVK